MSDSSATPWIVAHQAPLSMGFPRQEYWSGLLFPSLGDLSDPGIKPGSLALQADIYIFFYQTLPWGKPKRKIKWVKSLSYVRLFATSWTVAHQDSLSMGFPRQEYWSGLPFPSSGDLHNPGIKPGSPALAGGFFTAEPLGKPERINLTKYYPLWPTDIPYIILVVFLCFNNFTKVYFIY